jgi:hypothetical protein
MNEVRGERRATNTTTRKPGFRRKVTAAHCCAVKCSAGQCNTVQHSA